VAEATTLYGHGSWTLKKKFGKSSQIFQMKIQGLVAVYVLYKHKINEEIEKN
jgi:hypothetical protein